MFSADVRHRIVNNISGGQSFAVFRLPGDSEWRIAGQDGWSMKVNGFGQSYNTARTIEQIQEGYKSRNLPASTDTEAYLKAVTEIRHSHSSDGGKTVLSRIIKAKFDKARFVDNAEAFFDLNPDAFCLLMQIYPGKIRLMASPELLLEVKGEKIRTMALAGTRTLSDNNIGWDEKNIKEQEIVSSYIIDELKSMSLPIIETKTYTKKSNNVEHICTSIVSSLVNKYGQAVTYSQVLDAISPTPAVCGYPVKESKERIAIYETHDRDFYSGYTEVAKSSAEVSIYVNLRCAEFDMTSGSFAVYVGSGITNQSCPEEELKETYLKAYPILRIMQTTMPEQYGWK